MLGTEFFLVFRGISTLLPKTGEEGGGATWSMATDDGMLVGMPPVEDRSLILACLLANNALMGFGEPTLLSLRVVLLPEGDSGSFFSLSICRPRKTGAGQAAHQTGAYAKRKRTCN